jgi:hypothetical protein
MSGTGNYHGFFGFRTFSHERNVMVEGPLCLTSRLYPPYGAAGKERLRRLVEAVTGARRGSRAPEARGRRGSGSPQDLLVEAE